MEATSEAVSCSGNSGMGGRDAEPGPLEEGRGAKATGGFGRGGINGGQRRVEVEVSVGRLGWEGKLGSGKEHGTLSAVQRALEGRGASMMRPMVGPRLASGADTTTPRKSLRRSLSWKRSTVNEVMDADACLVNAHDETIVGGARDDIGAGSRDQDGYELHSG